MSDQQPFEPVDGTGGAATIIMWEVLGRRWPGDSQEQREHCRAAAKRVTQLERDRCVAAAEAGGAVVGAAVFEIGKIAERRQLKARIAELRAPLGSRRAAQSFNHGIDAALEAVEHG